MQLRKNVALHTTLNSAASDTANIVELGDDDYYACFTGHCWEVKRKWKTGTPRLCPNAPSYSIKSSARAGFEAEVKEWIDKGILELSLK